MNRLGTMFILYIIFNFRFLSSSFAVSLKTPLNSFNRLTLSFQRACPVLESGAFQGFSSFSISFLFFLFFNIAFLCFIILLYCNKSSKYFFEQIEKTLLKNCLLSYGGPFVMVSSSGEKTTTLLRPSRSFLFVMVSSFAFILLFPKAS